MIHEPPYVSSRYDYIYANPSTGLSTYEIHADHHLLLEIAAAMSEIQARSREEVGKRCRNILGEELEESSS